MSDRDRLFDGPGAPAGDFVFDDRVVRVFPDMIERSVPGYGLMLQLTALLAHRHAAAGSRVYDLGCSLGGATRAMRAAVGDRDVHFVAADSSADMVARCRSLLDEDGGSSPVDVVQGDICDLPVEDASMSVLNYTLQFLEPGLRAGLLARIASGTRAGGILLLTEKIRFDDSGEHRQQVEWHHDFKRARGYSELEIARKRDALERVLRPDTGSRHIERLLENGWSRAYRCFQAFNFAAYVAFR
ncbi:carboxy-S-adenosyl-L-methionine synthase CmoA [Elongatibacter sediminis]|uniref:Carboxy-S-adenosyl-L-methionine synthase n=1 Tax=Elongatibacter sediminis TaxID=3119006 RepID=A0AAW9RER5_9GAMM